MKLPLLQTASVLIVFVLAAAAAIAVDIAAVVYLQFKLQSEIIIPFSESHVHSPVFFRALFANLLVASICLAPLLEVQSVLLQVSGSGIRIISSIFVFPISSLPSSFLLFSFLFLFSW